MSSNVSLLLDGQLPGEEACLVLAELGADAKLRDRYTVYGLIGDTLRGISVPDDGFSVRIFDRIRREGVRMDPGYDPTAPAA